MHTPIKIAPGGRAGRPQDAGADRLAVLRDMMRSAWEAVLGAPPLAPEILDALMREATLTDGEAGRLLVASGRPATDLVLLVRGDAVVGSLQTTAGRGTALSAERAVSAPAWLDASSAWRDGVHAHDVQAASDVLVLRLPRIAAEHLVRQHPELGLRLLRVLADQIDLLSQTTRDLLHKDAEARFAVWLVQRLPAMSDHATVTTVVLSERKRDIAAQLGITPETLSRLLRSLTRKGLIEVVGYNVDVLDLPALRRLAEA